MRPSRANTFVDVRSARCFVCSDGWFGRAARAAAEAHADLTGHLVVVEVLTRTTYNPESMAEDVAEAVARVGR